MGIFKPDSKAKGKPGGQPTLRQQAMRYVERGEYSKAIAAYETLLPEELDKAAVFNIIGDLYEKMGNADEAFEQYEHAITDYVKEDQYRNAIGVAKKVLRYHKDRVEMYKRLADLYAQEGRVGDAILALNQYAEQMKESESSHIVAEIKSTIAQLKEKSLLVQSAVDLGREEKVVLPPPHPRHAEPPLPPVIDPEEEARRLEEERLVRELEEEIERELLSDQERIQETPPLGGPVGAEAPAEAAVAVQEARPEEETPAPEKKPGLSEEEEETLEKLVEEAIQASRRAPSKPAPAERPVQETIKLEAEVAVPAEEEGPRPPGPHVEGVAEAEASGVSFLELEELDGKSSLEEGAVFAELSSKPYDNEHFKSRFDQEVSRSDRYGRPLAFVLVQIGFLKRNNKAKGKKASPKVALVRKVGDCIRSALRDTDILAYNADGRIVLILPETAKEGALFVAQRLKARVSELLVEQDYEDEAERLWLGVLGYPKDARSKEDLVRRAQRMMGLGEEKGYAGKIVMLPD